MFIVVDDVNQLEIINHKNCNLKFEGCIGKLHPQGGVSPGTKPAPLIIYGKNINSFNI